MATASPPGEVLPPPLLPDAADAPGEPWEALARQQANELRAEEHGDWSTGRKRREVLACDLDDGRPTPVLERLVDPRPGPVETLLAFNASEREPLYLVGELAWLADPAAAAGYAGGPCPCCGTARLPWATGCIICSSTATSPARVPMQRQRAPRKTARRKPPAAGRAEPLTIERALVELAGGTGRVIRRRDREV